MERNIVECTVETFSQRLNVISTKSCINHTNLITNEALSILFLFERLGGATVFKNSGHLTFSITAKHTHAHFFITWAITVESMALSWVHFTMQHPLQVLPHFYSFLLPCNQSGQNLIKNTYSIISPQTHTGWGTSQYLDITYRVNVIIFPVMN